MNGSEKIRPTSAQVANRDNVKKRVVIIFKDGTQLAGDIYVHRNSRISDHINKDSKDKALTVKDAKYGKLDHEVFLAYHSDIRGIIPLD